MKTIHLSTQGAVATIALSHPPVNALDIPTIKELSKTLRLVAKDPAIAVVVLKSGLERAFSAGVSIQDHYPKKVRALFLAFHEVFRQLTAMEKVTMAVVDGVAFGGGCELLCCCDIVIASSRSRLGFPEVTVGCFPPVAAVRLKELVGPQKAAELIFTGEPVTADEAARIGLIAMAVPAETLVHVTDQWLDRLLAKSVVVLQKTAKALRVGHEDFSANLKQAEKIYLKELLKTKDAIEGLNAFLEKRPPEWKNK